MTAGIKMRAGQSPVIEGTRVTMNTLLCDFLDPMTTEADICKLYVSPEQVDSGSKQGWPRATPRGNRAGEVDT